MSKNYKLEIPETHKDLLALYKRLGADSIVLLMYSVRKLKSFYTSWEKKLKTMFDKLDITDGTYGNLQVTSAPGSKSYIDPDKVAKLCSRHGEDMSKLYSETSYTRLYIEPVKDEELSTV